MVREDVGIDGSRGALSPLLDGRSMCKRPRGENEGSSIYNTLTVRATRPSPGRHGATAEQRHVRVCWARD